MTYLNARIVTQSFLRLSEREDTDKADFPLLDIKKALRLELTRRRAAAFRSRDRVTYS